MGVMKKLLVWSLAIVILLFVSGFLFVTLSPVFGGKPDEQTRARMLASDNFKDDIFVNRHPVSDDPDSPKPPMGKWLNSVIFPPAGKHPTGLLPAKLPDFVAQQTPSFTWFADVMLEDTRFIFTPSKHFSGRKPGQRNDTLWGSWVVQAPEVSIYFSGDGGYSPDFAEIGKRFGPFDMAFMEDGAYSPYWPEIHMLPEESVQASLDVKAKNVMPIHWGKFDLAFHDWNEPVIRFTRAAEGKNLNVATPHIGETFTLESLPQQKWW